MVYDRADRTALLFLSEFAGVRYLSNNHSPSRRRHEHGCKDRGEPCRSGGDPATQIAHRRRHARQSGWGRSAPITSLRCEVAEAIKGAAAVGYRHFDCASVYGNEGAVGAALEEIMRGGIKRQDLWVTSKLWNDMHGGDGPIVSCEKSLADLRLDYLDLFLVHWPFPNFHPPGCDVSSRSPDAKPYIHENYMKTWRKMEELVDRKWVRHIGVSNMTVAKLKRVLQRCARKTGGQRDGASSSLPAT